MCTVLLPPGDNPVAVNKYIISIFSADFPKKKKKTQISNFIKIRPVGAEYFHTDERTDMTKLIVTSQID